MFKFRQYVIRKSYELSIVLEDSAKNLSKKVFKGLSTAIYTKKLAIFLKKYTIKHNIDKLVVKKVINSGDDFLFMSS